MHLIGNNVEDGAVLVHLHHNLKPSGLDVLYMRSAVHKDRWDIVYCLHKIGDQR